MLKRLSVENYALIDKLEMDLSPSLNIITGETGAGKSILLGALSLLLGARSEANTAKDADKSCVVEGVFDIDGYNLKSVFQANDLDYESTTTIRRVLSPTGKSRAYINELPVQLSTLKEVGTHLIDIHSQHQSLLIADDAFRTNIVDSVASHGDTLSRYGQMFAALHVAKRELSALRAQVEQSRKQEEYVRFQCEQIASLKLHEGEDAELESEQNELANAEQIRETLSLSAQELSSEEDGVLIVLKNMYHNLSRLVSVYPRSTEFAERIQSTYIELKDIESELSSESDRIESDPKRLEIVDQRLKQIYDLEQKHHVHSAGELMALERDFAQLLTQITDSDEAIACLETQITTLTADATALSAKITAHRLKSAALIKSHVEGVLAELGMPNGCFEVEISPLAALTESGADAIRFLFSSNKSVTPQPVERIASGGEISRVMLALKSQVARSTKLPTIIFDEIDTGVSGRIADKMGEIITSLSGSMQVINITHLPQVASKGETHFVVYKQDSATAATTHILRLDADQRVGEIAKMLSGSVITDAAMAQARLLLGR